jgi:hypothetical protein
MLRLISLRLFMGHDYHNIKKRDLLCALTGACLKARIRLLALALSFLRAVSETFLAISIADSKQL